MPTPKEMAAWTAWFRPIADKQIDRAGIRAGREITHSGTKELPFTENSITDYTVIKAASLDEAEKIAKGCPIVGSTRVYELNQ